MTLYSKCESEKERESERANRETERKRQTRPFSACNRVNMTMQQHTEKKSTNNNNHILRKRTKQWMHIVKDAQNQFSSWIFLQCNSMIFIWWKKKHKTKNGERWNDPIKLGMRIKLCLSFCCGDKRKHTKLHNYYDSWPSRRLCSRSLGRPPI